MKKIIGAGCLALAFALSACSEKKTTETQPQETPTETATQANSDAEAKDDTQQPAPNDGQPAAGTLKEIARTMQRSIINVVPTGQGKVGIRDFARAFAQQFDAYQPNRALASYLKNPKAFNAEDYGFNAIVDDANGFIRSESMGQYDHCTHMCYWRRPNGHSLVGVWMCKSSETQDSQYAYAFYDYDPASGTMTPDVEVNGTIENTIKRFLTDDVTLVLPQEGKDIHLTFFTYIDKELDDFDTLEKTLRWTGNGFRLVQ